MRRKGYRLTRWADDWVVTCQSRAEAVAALECARRVLAELGVTLHAEKTRIVHVRHGFEFLGFKIKRGSRALALPEAKTPEQRPHGHCTPIHARSPFSTSRNRYGSERCGIFPR